MPPIADPQYAADRMDTLYTDIQRYIKAYYTEGVSLITDREFDLMMEELVTLETTYPEFARNDSPTREVGVRMFPNANQEVVAHSPMYSLDNAYHPDSARRRFSALPADTWMYADLKHDGLAVRLNYREGDLWQALLRGNKRSGLNVIPYARMIRSIPLTVPHDQVAALCEITGEVTISVAALETLNQHRFSVGKAPYRTPRHAAYGILTSRAVDRTHLWGLEFTPYGVDGLQASPAFHSESLDRLVAMGFQLGPHLRFLLDQFDTALMPFYERYLAQYNTSNHPIDGVVVRVDSHAGAENLGYTERAPRFAIAFKFPEIWNTAKIDRIEFQIGRTGRVCPVAVFTTPVEIRGSTISVATIHSVGHLISRGYSPGCVVRVHKAGGVIPEMLDIVATPQDTPFTIPECCPSCGSPLIREGEHLYCRNENACEDILIQRTAFLVSRDCLDIKGVGISTVVPLVVADMLIRKPIDILRICADKALFQDHATSQVNVAAVVRRAQWRLQQLRQRDPEALQRLYLGLSIPGLTKRTWQRIQADFLALPTASAQVDALGNKLWLQARGISKLTALQLTNAIQRRYDEMLDVATLHTVSK